MGNWLKEVWVGQSKSRDMDEGPYRQPDGMDWDRLIQEMGKTQKELLNLAAGGGGRILIHDVEPQGPDNTVTDKTYIDVSGETVIDTFLTSSADVKISIISRFPICFVGETEVELDISADEGHYSKTINYSLIDNELTVKTLLPDGSTGAAHTVTFTVASGPTLLALEFTGSYPGSQTQLKAGDAFQISGVTNVSCVGARVNNLNACVEAIHVFPETNSFLVLGTIADRGLTVQDLKASVQAKNSNGAYGPAEETDNTVQLCNQYPECIDNGYVNHDNAGAVAFKGTEAGTQSTALSYTNTVLYESDDFIIDEPTVYAQAKSITCLNPGYYSEADNYKITATRTANAAVTIFEKNIEVADCAPLLTVSQADNRLRSEMCHVITITSNQNLNGAPALNIVVSGTWEGTFVANPVGQLKIWTNDLSVEHSHARGTASWTQVTPAQNRASINATITGDCTIGGFEETTVIFDHTPSWDLEPIANLSQVTDVIKLVCKDNADYLLTYQVDKTDHVYRYTITDAGGNPDPAGNYIYWCDAEAVGANTQGTAYLKIEENV